MARAFLYPCANIVRVSWHAAVHNNDASTLSPAGTLCADTQVGIAHYQMMVFTILAEAPPLAFLVRDRGLVWGGDNYNMYDSRATGFGPALVAVAGSVSFRHAVAVGLFVVGSVRQHEAIRHLASLRGPRGGGGDGSGKVGSACVDGVCLKTAAALLL